MKLTCTRENLSRALDSVSGVAGKHVNLPILVNILINAEDSKVELISTNLELAVKVNLRAKVEKKGSFTVPAKTLNEYVHLLNDEQVELELERNELKVTCGNSSTKIKGTTAEDFPVLPEIEEKSTYQLLVEPLRDSLLKTAVAAAKNEIRPELSGVFFNFFGEGSKGLTLAATDSYRLAEKKLSVASGEDPAICIVPGRAVQEMIRLLNLEKEEGNSQVVLALSEGQIILRFGSVELSSRLVDGTYPDYYQIIPSEFKTTSFFPVDIMTNKIKAASLFTTTGVNAVSFDFNVSDGNIGVSSTSTQKGEHISQVDAELTGEENSILLNHRYLLDGLQQMSGDVEFSMNSADSPCLIKEKGKNDYVYIVMPIRQ
ncbi:DNA polymerase III subunit beta [Patescibacteria group bacterium]|nr:DNA polymerase III subunit beta [Patescibacteria group bacterium]MBU1895864.1 DNA polymerase III subunit beta [Patescibacteria group bacterium]